MIRYILNSRTNLFWLLFHAALGAVSIITPWVLIVWFYIVLFTSAPVILKLNENHFLIFTSLIAYLVSFELLGRMAKASPFIPWETGKYMLFILLMAGILIRYHRGKIGLVLLLLLLPSVFFDKSGQVYFKNVVFNLLGPVNVALAVIYFKNQEVSKEELVSLLRLIALPAISVLSFVIIKTPDFENVEFELGSNFQTSGGFGSNQVSTILGLGTLLAYIFWRNRWNLTGYRWLDFILTIMFALRGLLTFSRGGMIGGALAILTLIYFETGESEFGWKYKKAVFNTIKAIPVILIFFLVFNYANKVSGGNLALRYQGETPGTLAGYKKKTANVFFSNRVNVFLDDMNLWKEHPVFGVGVGASMYMRDNTRRIASHVELSRLLSEHGLPGAVFFIVLCILGYKIYKQALWSSSGKILIALFILALFTTFHSSMRTYMTPLLTGLSMLTVYENSDGDQF